MQTENKNSFLENSDHGQMHSDHGQGGGQGVVNDNSDHGQTMVRELVDYGQKGYLTMVKAVDYSQLSEKTLRRRVREILVLVGLSWKSPQNEIQKRTGKVKKVNERKNIIGLTSFDWELSLIWLDELKQNIVSKPKEVVLENSGGGQEEDNHIDAQFMINSSGLNRIDLETIEIDGKRYTKDHLQDLLEGYKEEKETRKTMMELQKQINVVMAQMGQIQKMLLLKSGEDENQP